MTDHQRSDIAQAPMDLPTELRFGLEWELWILEQLLVNGAREIEVIETLTKQGVPQAQARSGVQQIAESKVYSRLRKRFRRARMGETLERLQTELSMEERNSVPVRSDIDRDSLLRDHWVRSWPVHLTHAANKMAAVSRWSFDYLAKEFGEVEVEVNTERTRARKAADTEKKSTSILLAEFSTRAQETKSNDFYIVSRNGLFSRPELKPLWADLTPLPSILEAPQFPRGVSLWMGPAGTTTPPHFDPHNVLLVQVQGRKRVKLAPRIGPETLPLLDGYYLTPSLSDAFGERVLTVELGRGEALFVPVGWFHEVTSLEPSITLSFLSFPWPNHFHWLRTPA